MSVPSKVICESLRNIPLSLKRSLPSVIPSLKMLPVVYTFRNLLLDEPRSFDPDEEGITDGTVKIFPSHDKDELVVSSPDELYSGTLFVLCVPSSTVIFLSDPTKPHEKLSVVSFQSRVAFVSVPLSISNPAFSVGVAVTSEFSSTILSLRATVSTFDSVCVVIVPVHVRLLQVISSAVISSATISSAAISSAFFLCVKIRFA